MTFDQLNATPLATLVATKQAAELVYDSASRKFQAGVASGALGYGTPERAAAESRLVATRLALGRAANLLTNHRAN